MFKNKETDIFETLKMFSIISVTSHLCKRIFSTLNIVRNKLRSTLKKDRLESLFTKQEITSIIDEFTNLSKQ